MMLDEPTGELHLPERLSRRIEEIAEEAGFPLDVTMTALLYKGVSAYRKDKELDDPRITYHLTDAAGG